MSSAAQRRLAAAHEKRHSLPDLARPDRQPRYAHGCQPCRFLGWQGAADLYWCGETGLLLARTGDSRTELIALPPDLARTTRTVALRIAWIAAEQRGLLPDEPRGHGSA